MNELAGASAFIASRLAGDGVLAGLVNGIWRGFAKEKTPFPFVTFSLSAASDIVGAGANARVGVRPLYLVQVIGETNDFDTLAQAAGRIDALLTVEEPVTVVFGGVSYLVLGALRERPMQAATLINGIRNEQLGGYYRLWMAGA